MTEKFNDINPEQLKKEVKEELLKREILMGLEEDEIDLFELFRVLLKHWKLIVVFPVIVALIIAAYSLTLTNLYKATATIFVHSSSKLGGLSSLPLSGLLPGLSGGGGGTDYLMAYLKSRTMTERIVARFGIATNTVILGNPLPNPDGLKIDHLIKAVDRIVEIEKNPDGLISIAVETASPELSADIAGAYIEFLNAFSRGPQKEKRSFIGKQLEIIGQELATAENDFKAFQDKHKMFTLEKQAAALIEKQAKLESELFSARISLQMQESLLKASGNVPELVKVEAQKVTEEAKISVLNKELLIAEKELENLPALAIEFARLQRTLTVKNKILEVLTEQYEMAKISETEEGSQFEVVDKPRAPEIRSNPKRASMVIQAGLSSGIIALFAAFLIEFIRRRKEREAKAAAAN